MLKNELVPSWIKNNNDAIRFMTPTSMRLVPGPHCVGYYRKKNPEEGWDHSVNLYTKSFDTVTVALYWGLKPLGIKTTGHSILARRPWAADGGERERQLFLDSISIRMPQTALAIKGGHYYFTPAGEEWLRSLEAAIASVIGYPILLDVNRGWFC